MRLNELFLTQEDFASQKQEKLKALKSALEDGKAVEIHNAKGTIKGWAWGDLEALGYAEKEDKPAGGYEVDERWVYKGPAPITLLTPFASIDKDGKRTSSVNKKVMQPGDATDWITVDYS